MRVLLGVLFGVVVVGSIYADYRWKGWMAARRAARANSRSDGDHRG